MRILIIFVAYMILALSIGFCSGLFTFQIIDLSRFWYLPITLFFFPSLAEEFVFRGLLVPRNLLDQGKAKTIKVVLLSSLVFVLWHPINALTINPTAQRFFLDPVFLLICFLLGITTALGYIVSRSLWVSIIMHWLTVVVWVIFLGGRNLIIER